MSRHPARIAPLGAASPDEIHASIVTSLPSPASLLDRSPIPIVDVEGLHELLLG
ncbi:MAG: hypothetical protein ACYDAN_11485 [Candidatus Limnocylindrales bacterium]